VFDLRAEILFRVGEAHASARDQGKRNQDRQRDT
jgi:hypothetical protein